MGCGSSSTAAVVADTIESEEDSEGEEDRIDFQVVGAVKSFHSNIVC